MVVVREDDDKKVIAYAEYRLVDEKGNEDPKGLYAWINDVWVHNDYKAKDKFNEILEYFIVSEWARFPHVQYIYWTRGKYKKRMSLYSVKKITRRGFYGRSEETRLHSTTTAGTGTYTAAV